MVESGVHGNPEANCKHVLEKEDSDFRLSAIFSVCNTKSPFKGRSDQRSAYWIHHFD